MTGAGWKRDFPEEDGEEGCALAMLERKMRQDLVTEMKESEDRAKGEAKACLTQWGDFVSPVIFNF